MRGANPEASFILRGAVRCVDEALRINRIGTPQENTHGVPIQERKIVLRSAEQVVKLKLVFTTRQ